VTWNVLLTVFLLILIEIPLHYVFREPNLRTSPGRYRDARAVWAEPDAELGWTASRRPEWHALDGLEYQVNQQGFRHPQDFALKGDEDPRRAVALGDSFIFGIHLPEGETFPRILNRLLGSEWDVINMGVPGYGIDQMVLSYEKYADVLRADAVLLIFIAEDIDRVFEAYRRAEGLSKPSFDLVQGKLLPRGPAENSLVDAFLGSSRLANLFYSRWYRPWQSRRISGALLRRLADSVSAHHATLIVAQYPTLNPDRKGLTPAAGMCDRALAAMRVICIDVQQIFAKRENPERFFLADGHPNGAANDLVARALFSRWPQ